MYSFDRETPEKWRKYIHDRTTENLKLRRRSQYFQDDSKECAKTFTRKIDPHDTCFETSSKQILGKDLDHRIKWRKYIHDRTTENLKLRRRSQYFQDDSKECAKTFTRKIDPHDTCFETSSKQILGKDLDHRIIQLGSEKQAENTTIMRKIATDFQCQMKDRKSFFERKDASCSCSILMKDLTERISLLPSLIRREMTFFKTNLVSEKERNIILTLNRIQLDIEKMDRQLDEIQNKNFFLEFNLRTTQLENEKLKRELTSEMDSKRLICSDRISKLKEQEDKLEQQKSENNSLRNKERERREKESTFIQTLRKELSDCELTDEKSCFSQDANTGVIRFNALTEAQTRIKKLDSHSDETYELMSEGQNEFDNEIDNDIYSKLFQEKSDLETMLRDQKIKYQNLKSDIESMESQLKEANLFLAKANDANIKIKLIKEDQANMIIKQKSELERLEDEIRTSTQNLNGEKEKCNDLSKNLEMKQCKIEKLENVSRQLETENEKLQSEIKYLEEESTNQTLQVQDKIKDTEFTKKQNGLLEGQISILKDTNEKLRSELESIQNSFKTQKMQIEYMEKENRSLKLTNGDFCTKLKLKTEELRKIEDRAKEAEDNNTILQEEKKDAISSLESLKKKNRDLTAEVERLSSRLRKRKDLGVYGAFNQKYLTAAFDELKNVLQQRLNPEEIDICLHLTTDASTVKGPFIVFCKFLSRLGTDVSEALQGINVSGEIALIILHHKEEHALQLQASEKILSEPGYKKLGAIIDLAIFSNRGIYDCNMNEIGLEKLVTFLKRF